MSCKTKICMKNCDVNTMTIGSPQNQDTGFRFNIGYFEPGRFLPLLLLPQATSDPTVPMRIEATPDIAIVGRWFVPSFNFSTLVQDILEPNPTNPNPDPPNELPFFWVVNLNDEFVNNPRFGGPFTFPSNAMNPGAQFIVSTINMNQETRYLRVGPDRLVGGVADPSQATLLQLFDVATVPIIN